MSKTSDPQQTKASHCEVTTITHAGFWFLAEDREYFIPFADYPVFARATPGQITAIEQIAPRQFHWPALDADVEVDALDCPGRYTLTWHV